MVGEEFDIIEASDDEIEAAVNYINKKKSKPKVEE